MKRRTLTFQTIEDLREDARGLIGRPYVRAGKWSLGQVCEHLSTTMEKSMDGFGFSVPFFIRLFGRPAKWWVLRSKSMPAGAKAPRQFAPPDEASLDDSAAAARLVEVCERYRQHAAPLHPSPLFGAMSRQEWDQIHLIHAAHHLSFILPTPGS